MSPLKKLASQTAIYGVPTIVGRLLTYLLNPLFTYNFSPAEIGIQSAGYAYTSFLLVLLTYGMETTLFRFSQKEQEHKETVYTTALISVFISSFSFLLIIWLLAPQIANKIKFTGHPEYVIWFAVIVAADAFSSISFAKLREQGRAKRFAFIKTIQIAIFIGLNLFFILFCKRIYDSPDEAALKPFVSLIYNPKIGVGYIFISNLIASIVTILLLLPEFLKIRLHFNKQLWKRMLVYAIPLLIGGLAGMVNETLDRILLTYLLPSGKALAQIGIYSACYKVSIIMTIFIQAFRFAAEPFFFSRSKEKDSKETMAHIMKFFVIICSIIFLATMMNIEWIQYFAGSAQFRTGIKVVPVLLLANLFLGIFINQSIWYKLSGQTHFGALLTIFGACITILLNILWIPRFGYMGSAWATFICYAGMMIASYFVGNKYYPVNYDIKSILGYLTLSITLYFVGNWIHTSAAIFNIFIKNCFVLLFIGIAWKFEKTQLKSLL